MARPTKTRKHNPFNAVPHQAPGKNRVDRSHEYKTTFKMGQLIPFLTEECIPGDVFMIGHEIMLRFLPLVFPIMHRLELKTHLFFVPNKIIWPDPLGWEDFITRKETVEWAYVTTPEVSDPRFSQAHLYLATYMGVPIDPDKPLNAGFQINALPFAAYTLVWDEFYRADQIQAERFTQLTEGDNTANYQNIAFGLPMYKAWNHDYFTSALPEAQAGEDVLVPMTGENFPQGSYIWNRLDGTQPPIGTRNAEFDTPLTVTYLQDADGNNMGLDVQRSAATIRDLRLAVRLQEWLEKLNLTGQRYRDMLRGFFGVDPNPGAIDDPVYLGGSAGRVVISEVMSTADTFDETGQDSGSFVGSYTGQALGLQSKFGIKYHCNQHGWIIGLISVCARSGYAQGLDRKWTRKEPLEYAWTQFAHIGDQEVKNQEIYWQHQTGNQDNEEAFGYIPRYSEYRFANDVVSGQMRDTLRFMHLNRWFDNLPTLNQSFLEARPRAEDVFQGVDNPGNIPGGNISEHEVFAHIWNQVYVVRALPRYGVPRL